MRCHGREGYTPALASSRGWSARLLRESLNLQVTIAEDGKVTPDLQSPVNPDAKKCILDAVKAWSVRGAGVGKAMVLLSIE